jgi:hypothetical protein
MTNTTHRVSLPFVEMDDGFPSELVHECVCKLAAASVVIPMQRNR